LKIFLALARQAFQFISAYRFNFFMELILAVLRMYGIYWVWRMLYTQRPGAFGVDLNQMVTYGVMGMALDIRHISFSVLPAVELLEEQELELKLK
jgi:ABC-type uncharacterized transport system permease subunit